ncbi:unnamed protein product [Penicillium pancosmium]
MMINHSYPNGDESLAQEANFPDQDSQYARTQGYYEQTPSSEYGLSPSPGRCHQDGLDPFSSPQPDPPKLLQLFEWEASSPDKELPGNVIQYIIEWKVKMNNRSVSEDTEQDVALTPSAYWPLALKAKLEKVIEDKVSRRRRVRSDDTSIVVSVNDRKRRDLKKRFSCLNIDWTTMEKQLLEWGKLYIGSKELRLDDRFPISTTGKKEKRGRSSVTKRMLNERDEQLDAEQHTSGEQSIWRAVYSLMRCWQDPHGKKHYQLRTHHLKRLIAYVERGGILECQDDVPDRRALLGRTAEIGEFTVQKQRTAGPGKLSAYQYKLYGGATLSAIIRHKSEQSVGHRSATKSTDIG